jgi:hypothetical protein
LVLDDDPVGKPSREGAAKVGSIGPSPRLLRKSTKSRDVGPLPDLLEDSAASDPRWPIGVPYAFPEQGSPPTGISHRLGFNERPRTLVELMKAVGHEVSQEGDRMRRLANHGREFARQITGRFRQNHEHLCAPTPSMCLLSSGVPLGLRR